MVTTSYDGANTASLILTLISALCSLAVAVLVVIAQCKMFKKLGYHPLLGLVPYYSYYLLLKRCIDEKRAIRGLLYVVILSASGSVYGLLSTILKDNETVLGIISIIFIVLVSVVGVLNFIAQIRLYFRLPVAFGRSPAQGWLFIFFQPIMVLIYGFNKNFNCVPAKSAKAKK